MDNRSWICGGVVDGFLAGVLYNVFDGCGRFWDVQRDAESVRSDGVCRGAGYVVGGGGESDSGRDPWIVQGSRWRVGGGLWMLAEWWGVVRGLAVTMRGVLYWVGMVWMMLLGLGFILQQVVAWLFPESEDDDNDDK